MAESPESVDPLLAARAMRIADAVLVITGTALAAQYATIPDGRAALVAAGVVLAFLFPVAIVHAGRPLKLILDGPVIFSAFLILPPDQACVGAVVGAAIGQRLHSRGLSWGATSAIHAVAIVAAVAIIGTAPSALEPAELLMRGAAASGAFVLVILVLHLSPRLVAGHLRLRGLPAAVAPSLVSALGAFCCGLLAALASRSSAWAPFALAVPVVLVVRVLRQSVRLREDASHDPLTGLPNRRTFEAFLSGAMSRFDRRGERFSVIAIDLDTSRGSTTARAATTQVMRCSPRWPLACGPNFDPKTSSPGLVATSSAPWF